MKRYNLGFKWFGLLEQCNNGELVKYEDSKTLIRAICYKKNNIINQLEQSLQRETKRQWASIKKISELEKQNKILIRILAISIIGHLLHLFQIF